MLRKFSFIAVAAVSLGAAALGPTSASAYELGGHHGGDHRSGVTIVLGGPGYYGYDDCDHDYDYYRHHPRRWRPL
ncbi:hypothetical protein [Bradyrhizobium sp. Gha]|uniref:hypothetical protein n=1 Tax=Bradyrhizobium sp. Gha TaxID=1855318 RepID=UPI0008F05337|nr:hypothetical protein [Bradyrhizobium sp. Gha]SFJ80496.1 hypothetical protein SAMN05216525_13673 [Bradyrhizobium sp. Gha]